MSREHSHDRRWFLQVLAATSGAAALGALAPWQPLLAAASNTDVLLLSCMDFRLVDATAAYMKGRGLAGKYDHIVLAGAALGAVTPKYPDWNKTFWDHLAVAIDLHHIKKVIILDHRDCGAYQVILGEGSTDAAREKTVHTAQLRSLGAQVKAKHPKLDVEMGLMALDGKVEAIPAAAGRAGS